MFNQVIQGDCAVVLKTLPDACTDFVLTDPPYFVRYKDRSGRTIRNDRYPGQVLDVFNDVYRVLKPDSLCVSFYGWNRVDSFFSAWKGAGFAPVGHIVFSKTYASAQRFLRYSHESAYVLAKGRPELPADPLSDVLPWHYSGNHNHPTEKSVDTIKPIIEAFTKAGDVVLDPFSGSGSSLVAAALLGRKYIGIELEQKYCDHARRRLAGVMRHLAIPRREPQREGGIGRAGPFQGSSSDLRRDPA
ncbi:MAG TPA: DNA methyltransferase [Bryobacteraceae bacterium]|jgi:adenine-specific DNA-methyltransferase|nr:DNA methyltransferase [Bryobacteraceae bacterium]